MRTETNHLQSPLPVPRPHVPDPIASPAVAPAALYLLEPVDAALFSSEAAPGPVNVLDSGFRIDGKMKKEVHHFTI